MELDEKPASTSCDKATMTDCEFNPVAGIIQVPHKQISSTMMESESSCDEVEKNDLSPGQNGHPDKIVTQITIQEVRMKVLKMMMMKRRGLNKNRMNVNRWQTQ